MEYVEKLEKLVREGKLLEALDFIEALSPEKLQQWQIQNLIGVICANCGEPKAARNFFEAALKQQPNDAAVLYNLVKTCASLGLNRRARKLLDCCGQHANSEDVKHSIIALRQELTESLSNPVRNRHSLPPQKLAEHGLKPLIANVHACAEIDAEKAAELFLSKNYNYVWLKAMLNKASKITDRNAVLITGSSYGVNGILESCWKQVVNCSASSQDLYYDFMCAKRAISTAKQGCFSKCFIVDGYYVACHDLSYGPRERELMIPSVYYPLFQNGHNWREANSNDLWSRINIPSDADRQLCEQIAVAKMLQQGTFFSESKRHSKVFDLGEQNWQDIPAIARQSLGKIRADSHNKLFQNKSAIEENKKILNDYIHFLHLNEIMPVFVIAPFTPEYTQHISWEMKASVFDLLASISEPLYFLDFNQFSCFESSDFVDTDHLSQKGAKKFSCLLAKLFNA